MDNRDIIIGIDAGTSVVKAVAFDLQGQQLGTGAVRNHYHSGPDGSAQQDMARTWRDCVRAIRLLALDVANLAQRTAALAVTAQGDGSWLVGKNNQPVSDAWIWLDGRAAPTVQALSASPQARARFEATGTGLNTCQQGAQLAHMSRHYPDLLQRAEVALHCKDWLYLNLTGVRATDPSEASFTFGNFRHRHYDDRVIDALGLSAHRRLLPEIIEGTQTVHPLTTEAAHATGLYEGTPVCLGYVDMVMTALGAGVHTGEENTGCSIVGSTGVHMRAVSAEQVWLNQEQTGYVIALPLPGMVTQVQTNMAATLNLDWALQMAESLINDFGGQVDHGKLVSHIDRWLSEARPDSLLFHPYISEAGERGPFVNADARASFIGLNPRHGFADLLRAVIEGIGLAARDCYQAMGEVPREIRLSGGAGRSARLREIFAAALGAPVRVNVREEAGAAGAAMMAAVAIGAYADMESCIDSWVTPLLGSCEQPDALQQARFTALYDSYRQARTLLPPVWSGLHDVRKRFES
ncbi:carbohydrate kinase [Izhakiella australiensis]|uniref:Carbohydrate kinase n=1 Tax=Izhakiella australiensis TaxID=1926881 RepID=A0A1S8YHU5_9GAMM|nr:FGGY-family carbohydrate kinase [Izhakiella australiensis]OON38624.1 carbohydrate kinase [Izhakiella australiensis]